MIDKKYLVTNGCSFTQGHILGPQCAWPKFLGEELNLEVINMGKGGSGNDTITWRTLEFCEVENEIAKKSFFVIQLTECLRYHVYYDNLTDTPEEWHITPLCFNKNIESYLSTNNATKWIYKNRNELFYIYNNITFALYKTFQNIISITSYLEKNNYPYIIFDGINDHKPFKYEGYYYLRESHNSINQAFKLKIFNNANFIQNILNRDKGYLINEKIITNIFNSQYFYKEIPVMLNYFINKGIVEHNDYDYYFRGNSGHPNAEASKIWSKILAEYINKIF